MSSVGASVARAVMDSPRAVIAPKDATAIRYSLRDREHVLVSRSSEVHVSDALVPRPALVAFERAYAAHIASSHEPS
jgi:hypothetical protein